MRMSIHRASLCFAMLAFSIALPVWGHGVDLYARVEGSQIMGGMNFADGTPATDCPVKAYGPDDSLLDETRTDDEGKFSLHVKRSVPYRLVGEPGHGHRGRYTVPLSEILTALLAGTPETAEASGPVESSPSPQAIDVSTLEAAIARQLGPLRDQLHAHEKRVRLRDILGGIGYVFGLAGVYVLLKQRSHGGKSGAGD